MNKFIRVCLCIILICRVFTLNLQWSSNSNTDQTDQIDQPVQSTLRKSSNETSSVQRADQEPLRQPIIGRSNPDQTAESSLPKILNSTSTTLEKSMSGSRTKNSFFSLLAGINPYESKPLSSHFSYLGYLLHFAAVRYMLDEAGSTMDFNILMRIQNGLDNTIPESQSTFFSKLRMKIEYLPQDKDDNWKSYMMDKFQILRYHEYKKILFVDADVLPLCNWDHYFDMSERGVFAPNFVFAYNNEPAQGGFFLISPEPGDWEKYSKIPAFMNNTMGFGIPLAQPAEGIGRNFTDWNWYGSTDDQGMLYH